MDARERAAQVMEHLCTHASHGYSQYSRQGDGGTETVTLSDGTTVTVATGDRDCSSAVIDAWSKAVPGCTGGATYTGNMRSNFVKSGLFEWHPWGDGYTAKRGDVYLNETHHTAMCLGNGKLGEFSISETGGIDGAEGDQTGWESHICNFYTYSKGWDGILAYKGDDDILTDTDIKKIADAILAEDVNGVCLASRITNINTQVDVCAHEVTRKDDCSGRGVEMSDHDHIKWMAAKQAEMYDMLAAILDAVSQK